MTTHTKNGVPVRGTATLPKGICMPHRRITELADCLKIVNIHCVIQPDGCITIGHFPHVVEVTIEVLEIPEYRLTHELYRVHVWRTKEVFHHVAIGPGYLLSKLLHRGLVEKWT